MREYTYFREQKIIDFSDENIEKLYSEGFVFTRLGKGVMHQIESVRVPLLGFELSSENKRILKKFEKLSAEFRKLPFSDYDWRIAKSGADFYTEKFGKGVMSVNKLRELFTEPGKANVNWVFVYRLAGENMPIGYCLAYVTSNIIHYSYPFYDLERAQNIGMAMMLKAVLWAKEHARKYIYLGSRQRYKLQFKGVEVFDRESWNVNREL